MESGFNMQKEKIKIGVHIPNGNIPDVQLTNPELGNPGIGGTPFLLFSLPYYLKKYFENEFEFLLLAENEKTILTNFETVAVKSLTDAARIAKRFSCEIIIFRPSFDKQTLSFLKEIKELKIKSIAWMHNTPMLLLNHLHRNDYITRCVCVGREQYEKLRDHAIINKLSMIFNAVDLSHIHYDENIRKTKLVVFLGSLVFAKGF
ncbi:unnamed protein product, partial [marine sediment metagenome]